VKGCLFLLMLIDASAYAQTEAPRFEAFAGYSYLPAGPEDFPRGNSHGVQASIAGNLNRWLGFVMDVGAQHSSKIQPFVGGTVKTTLYEYLAGPRFSIRTPPLNVFVHALVGGASGRTDIESFSDTELAIGLGGGVDIHLNKRIAIRAIQVDYFGSFADTLENNARVGTGIVFKF
jgi:opacity protein-like surface antigen